MKKCIFAGTFDPPTVGHLDTIEQAAKIFDEVVVAILINQQKTPFFTIEERKEMLKILCSGLNVKIVEWQGVVAELLKEENTPFYVRGIRNTVDLEYENAALYASKRLNSEIVPVYLPAKQELLHVSSTLVKNSILFNTPYEEYVGEGVASYIQKIVKERGKGNV